MEDIVIVMPFQEGWTDQVWNTLEGIASRDSKKNINVTRVDLSTPADEWLATHIENINRKARVIIADISNSNANVMIEVGLALAQETPLLLITQDMEHVPAHLRGRIIEVYNPDDSDSLKKLQQNLYLRLKEILSFLQMKLESNILLTNYDVECFASRSDVHLEKYFNKAKYRIDILTTNLSFLHEEYDDSAKTYFDEICKALDNTDSKTKLRILTLDPESDFAAKRGRQLGYAPRVFRDTLRSALAATREVAKRYETVRFEVRAYDDFPNQITYRIDDEVFHCVVAQPTQSRRHLTFKLHREQTGVGTSFTEHFQYIWSRAT